MSSKDEVFAALIALHQGLERQGPGDAAFTKQMLALLPPLPEAPRIADLGCGSGTVSLLLAEHFNAPVTAVDLCRAFLDQAKAAAKTRGLGHLLRVVEADMGDFGGAAESIDLLWSEGAAYNLTFKGAVEAWRPLMAPGGVAVISELSWFVDSPPAPIRDYWEAAYPAVANEAVNAERAVAAGFEVLAIHRLPSAAWWENYYGPLQARIAELKPDAGDAMQRVIAETEEEIARFAEYGEVYGYSFYLLRAV
jgi:SAM-dependent methyltransferase